MSKTTSVIIAGVGGQGTILASRLLGCAAMQRGLDVKVSEVHGMAQRGGSVITYVRYADRVFSPVIGSGEADFLIAFEQLETARWMFMLKKGGVIVGDSRKILPAPVLAGKEAYPDDIPAHIRRRGIRYYEIDALGYADRIGFAKAANVALMGSFAAVSDFTFDEWEASIRTVLAGRYIEQNIKAFRTGYESIKSF